MRKIIISVLAILLLLGAILIARYFINSKNAPKPKFDKLVKTVEVDTVVNTDVPIIITASGKLTAKNRIELYSEVQGVLRQRSKEFKAGTHYNKGEILLSINSDEFYASLQSQKSNLFNLITSVLPDIRLDYPEQFDKWDTYVRDFDMNKATPPLPKFDNDKEKYFITGRGITTAYYNVKNLEVKLSKYNLKAPFSGVLTEALVTPGSLVRVGQKLGEFIDPGIYELEVAVKAAYAPLLKIGNTVALHDMERTLQYSGKVIRVNSKIDQTSQTVTAFILVSDPNLKDGMYLEADLTAKSEKDAYEIDRTLLVNDKQVYMVNDTVLKLIDVNPVYFDAHHAVIKGIPEKTVILSQMVPGAYDGMPVKINSKL